MISKIINLKKMLVCVCLLVSVLFVKAQSNLIEVSWNDFQGINYTGLIVLYPNNLGKFKVFYNAPYLGRVWVMQDARFSVQFDIYGNRTSFINCSNPRSPWNIPYSADNFMINPDGSMFTMDFQGSWSTQIVAVIVDPKYWRAMLNKYGM